MSLVLKSIDMEPSFERISFVPHPRTLTCAGDYEYWAAQGRSPLPCALAELIDNSLQALLTGGLQGEKRVVISLLVSGPSKGLISVWDNGTGMDKRQLNDWAVMNLAMEDREQEQCRTTGGCTTNPRFLTGNLSYFGVGSKNAAFYLGRSVKMTTKERSGPVIHELQLEASVLEQRYKAGQEVYTECLVSRQPCDTATVGPLEEPFKDRILQWVNEEAMLDGPEGLASFTRITIGDVKPHIVKEIYDDKDGSQLCRHLSHLYYYYLHGPSSMAPTGESQGRQDEEKSHIPSILLECWSGGKLCWKRLLNDIDDDMESLYLKAKKSEFEFTLDVPGKGLVGGVLWYFPCENGCETTPLTSGSGLSAPVAGQQGEGIMTQWEGMTQQTSCTQKAITVDDEGLELPTPVLGFVPMFEAFWQGRLIPGARIETLPFVEAVRTKRSAAVRDALPDEVFCRIRGALFFGPEFLVTRNKLSFRDNLNELLQHATSAERSSLERRFKDWLSRCHCEMDKNIRFECMSDSATQAAARGLLGELVTAFDKISDHSRTIRKGDIVQISTKPSLLGEVIFFTVEKVVRGEGAFASGQVTIRPLPEDVHGQKASRTVHLRRLICAASEEDIAEWCKKECAKLPATLRVEPMRFGSGLPLEFVAGECLPETSVVVCNTSGQSMVRGIVAGAKYTFAISQRLWKVKDQTGTCPAQPQPEKPRKGKKKYRGGGVKVVVAHDEPNDFSELLLEVENSTPVRDGFRFARITDGLCEAGHYFLEFVLSPPLKDGQLSIKAHLTVLPGPASQICVQGEGRITAAVKEVMLGEFLPSVTVVFKDEHGNETGPSEGEEGRACLEAIAVSEGGSEECPILDIQVAAQQEVASASAILLDAIQFLGSHDAGTCTSLFCSSTRAILNGHGHQEDGKGISMKADMRLRIRVASLPSVSIPLQVRPGAPKSIILLPGHPWDAQVGDVVLTQCQAACPTLLVGEELPGFEVVALDSWGNCTAPSEDMHFNIIARCSAMSPSTLSIPVPSTGIARVQGLQAQLGRHVGAAPVEVTLALDVKALTGAAQAAVDAAGPTVNYSWPVLIGVDGAPTALALVYNGQELPIQVDESGEVHTAVLDGIPAGSRVEGLAFYCLDGSGQPASSCTAGKVQVSWVPSFKKVDLKNGPLSLPPFQAPEDVGEVGEHVVRFKPHKKPIMELTLSLVVVPSSPTQWSLRHLEAGSQRSSAHCDVHVGQPFCLEVEAQDEFGNRCGVGGENGLPCPVLEVAADRNVFFEGLAPGASLPCTGPGQAAGTFKVTLIGKAGPVTLHVSDKGGSEGSSLLSPDDLQLNLAAGVSCNLAFDAPQALTASTRAVLHQLRVFTVDIAGNPTKGPDKSCEVTLQPSGLAVDGSGLAVNIAAAGGNKAKITAGVAVFLDVKLQAEQPGTYQIRAKSTSRAVAGEAEMDIALEASNRVSKISLDPIKEAELEGPGQIVQLHVIVETEDCQPLCRSAVQEGLSLCLLPPKGGRSDAIPCSLSQDIPDSGGTFVFKTPPLEKAGTWTVTAEYRELRPELARALPKKEAFLRSIALLIHVSPGPACSVSLEGACPIQRLTVTNGSSREERVLLEAPVFQARDCFGNTVLCSGLNMALHLAWACSSKGNADLPSLEAPHLMSSTDKSGRVKMGDVVIAEGTGRLHCNENRSANVEGGTAAEMVLSLRPTVPEEWQGFVEDLWHCPVLFTDSSAVGRALKQLNTTLMEKGNQQQHLSRRLQDSRAAQLEAEAGHTSACKRLESLKCQLQTVEAPSSAEIAKAHLDRLRAQEDEAIPSSSLSPRYGPPGKPLTAAIDRCLNMGDKQVIGVFAAMGTVEDAALSSILGAHYRGYMQLVLVADNGCRERVTKKLAREKLPVPDMLAFTHMQGYSGSKGSASPPLQEASAHCQQLVSSACSGSDPPLSLPLPHTKALGRCSGQGACPLGPLDWPDGCCGYAFNLVRPVISGHRTSLLQPLLGQTLVFETLRTAAQYRETMTQVIKASCPDIVTLDGKRITSKGIVSGSTFEVPPVETAMWRFGSSNLSGKEAHLQRQQDVAVLHELLQAFDDCAVSHALVQQVLQVGEVEDLQRQLDALQEECRELEIGLARVGTQREGRPGNIDVPMPEERGNMEDDGRRHLKKRRLCKADGACKK
eukprot:jgi/Botrbrau1/14781/Bobra.0284s0014.2